MNRNSVSGIPLTTSSNSVLELSKFRLTTLCIQSSSHRVYARALHRYRRGHWFKSRSENFLGFLFAVHNRDALSFINNSNNGLFSLIFLSGKSRSGSSCFSGKRQTASCPQKWERGAQTRSSHWERSVGSLVSSYLTSEAIGPLRVFTGKFWCDFSANLKCDCKSPTWIFWRFLLWTLLFSVGLRGSACDIGVKVVKLSSPPPPLSLR